MSSNMNSVETKEIRGLNLRNIVTLLACTITIVTTVLGSYFSLQSDLRDIKTQKEGERKFDQLRYELLDVRINANEKLYRELSLKYEEILKFQKQNKN